jgi:DNA-directed RNA polymerase subunit L
MIKNIKKVDDKTLTFVLGPTTVGHANAIKRIFKAYIPIVAFDPNGTIIHDNNSSVRVEFIRHRIEMLPIDNSQFNQKNTPESVTFELKVKNEAKDYQMLYVQGKHLVASDKKTYFDPNFLIHSLKPGQSLHLEAKLKNFDRRTIVNRNVALVFYTYDQEKNIKDGTFEFNFVIESFDSLPISELFQVGKKVYVKLFNEWLTNLDNPEITIFDHTTNSVTIISDDPDTFGNAIVQDILVYSPNKENITFCGYRQPHPTKQECIIRIELKDQLTDSEKNIAMMKQEISDAILRLIKKI